MERTVLKTRIDLQGDVIYGGSTGFRFYWKLFNCIGNFDEITLEEGGTIFEETVIFDQIIQCF